MTTRDMALDETEPEPVETIGKVPEAGGEGEEPYGASKTEEGMEFHGVLQGGILVRVAKEGAPDVWVMAYRWPPGSNTWLAWQFDDADQIALTFGPNWLTEIDKTSRNESWLQNVEILGGAEEVVGMKGTFNKLFEDTMAEAARIAGINDPSIVSLIANDPEFQEIMAKAALGGWTETQITAAKRNTNLWKNVLYPGIESLYGQTTQPEIAWANYAQTVQAGLKTLGWAKDPDGTYRQTIGEMLGRGIDEDIFVEAVPTFVRAAQSEEYFQALSQWSKRTLGKRITFGDWFSVLEGEAEPELQQTFEAAQVQYAMGVSGIDDEFGPRRVGEIVAGTDMTLTQLVESFNDVEKQLLAVGDSLDRFGLTKRQLLEAATGISTSGGRSPEWIRRQAAKAALELGMADDINTELFVGYHSQRGTPERPGLNALAPEQ